MAAYPSPIRPRRRPPTCLLGPADGWTRAGFAALALALALILAGGAVAQKRKPRKSRAPQTAETALAAFEKVKDQAEGRRQVKLTGLGRFASPAIDKTLVEELDRAESAGYRRAVIRAIGQRPRQGVLEPLLRLFDDASTASFTVRYDLASAIGKQGDAAVAPLVSRLGELSASSADRNARQALLRALGTAAGAGSEAAVKALIAESSNGSDYDRYAAMQNLANAPKSEALTALRLQALESKYAPLQFQALKQLADEGHPKVKDAALEIYESAKKRTVNSFNVAQLAEVFADHLDESTFGAFVGSVASAYQQADRLLKKVEQKVDTVPGFLDWLLSNGIRSKVPAERVVAVRLIAKSAEDRAGDILLKLVTSKDSGLATMAIRALAERRDQRAVPYLRRALKARGDARPIEAMHALNDLIGDTPAWRSELLGLLRGRHVQKKVLAMDLLAARGEESLLPEVYKLMTHKSWVVRAAAYDYCRTVRSLKSVAPLIARVDTEKGRLREDCLDALKAITSYRLPNAKRWRSWWAESKATFKMPTIEQALGKSKSGSRRAAKTISSFFDIPLVSTRVIFVLDVSGSMSAPMGTVSRGPGGASTSKRTRIVEAKRQLTRVIGDIPDDAIFNLIYFQSSVDAFAKKARKASRRAKNEALASVKNLRAGGGTNIHDALELAFVDEDVDTIYLLSDGAPSAGKITDPTALAAEVARWNQTRRIRIHTISIGSKSKLMEQLAKESGGVSSHFK